MFMKRWNKKGVDEREILKWFVAIVILVIVVTSIMLLFDRSAAAAEFVKGFLRFGK